MDQFGTRIISEFIIDRMLARAHKEAQASPFTNNGPTPYVHPADCKGCPDCGAVMGDATYAAMEKGLSL